MDLLALGGLATASAVTLLAFRETRRGRARRAVAGLAVAALCLTAPLSWRFELSRWDERYHALAAKNVAERSLLPLLVARPISEAEPADWRSSHQFLHKPPLTFWLMGAARALLGPSEVALRVPSWLALACLVVVVFGIARRFVSEPAALAAAAFTAWNGRLILVASGLRATDHVDTIFTFTIALGALAALRATEALAGERSHPWLALAGVGVATGLGLLTKDLPALVVVAFFGLVLVARGAPWRSCIGAPAVALAIALAIAAPWWLRLAIQLPAAAQAARELALEHVVGVVEGHVGGWWFHLALLPRDFGLLAPLALALFCGYALLRAHRLLPVVGWLFLVYGAFAFAATKMEQYVLIAAPAIFLALGWFVGDALPAHARRGWRLAHHLAVASLATSAVVGVWAALGPFEERVRDPLWAKELRWLGSEVSKLPGPRRVVFDVPWPIECMFYVDATCVAAPATDASRARAQELGFSVAEYGVTIPHDPRTLPARALASALRELRAKRVLVFNAVDAEDLRVYLGRFLRRTSVSGELPGKGRRLSRALAHGARIVVLVAPGESPSDMVGREFPDAVFIESARYARRASRIDP